MAKEPSETSKVVKLAEFIAQKRRAECAVCSLPAEIRTQVSEGRKKKGYPIDEIIEWLKSVGHEVARQSFTTHTNGHHDDKAA